MNVGRFVTMWVRGMFSDEMLGKENKGWIVRREWYSVRLGFGLMIDV